MSNGTAELQTRIDTLDLPPEVKEQLTEMLKNIEGKSPQEVALVEPGGVPVEPLSSSAIQRWIDNLSMSAEAKSLINEVLGKTVEIGGAVIRIGKRIVEAIIGLVKQFPRIAIGVVFALLIGFVVATIPLIGGLLAPIVGLIIAAFGLHAEYVEWQQDVRDRELTREIARHTYKIQMELEQVKNR